MKLVISSLQVGVERFGGRRHFVNYDRDVTGFFCGARGVRTPGADHKGATCPTCIAEADRLQFGRI